MTDVGPMLLAFSVLEITGVSFRFWVTGDPLVGNGLKEKVLIWFLDGLLCKWSPVTLWDTKGTENPLQVFENNEEKVFLTLSQNTNYFQVLFLVLCMTFNILGQQWPSGR